MTKHAPRSTGTNVRVGLIGLGEMGAGLASSVLRAGLPLRVFDVRRDPVSMLAERGAVPASSPADVAAKVDITAVCVVDEQQVEEVVLGANGILATAPPGATVILHSTLRPDFCRQIAEICSRNQVDVLDVGMSGYADKALSGDLTLMIGGSSEVVERSRPYLEAIGSSSLHLGPVGSGEIAKLANNVMAVFCTLGMYEGLRLAHANGIDEATMAEVAAMASGASDALDRWRAGHRNAPGNSGRSILTDVGYGILDRAVTTAQAAGADLPFVSAIVEDRQR